MSDIEIELEIHSPGLNLHSSRWHLHTLFLQEVESIYEHVAAEAWKQHEAHGRGTLSVDQEHWMEILRGEWHLEKKPFPSAYLSADMTIEEMDLGALRRGFRQMLDDYDPEKEVVLSVHHHPGDMVSCYLFTGEPTPPECYERQNRSG